MFKAQDWFWVTLLTGGFGAVKDGHRDVAAGADPPSCLGSLFCCFREDTGTFSFWLWADGFLLRAVPGGQALTPTSWPRPLDTQGGPFCALSRRR